MNLYIIVPCYNEELRLPVDEFENFFYANKSINFLFVNDGSTDGTSTILNSLSQKFECCSTLNLNENSGKAEAVRQGVGYLLKKQDADIIGVVDADLATPLSEILRVVDHLTINPKLEIIFGSRVRRAGARIERNIYRHYLGRVFATAASLLLNEDIYDTQCGFKFFKRNPADVIFSEKFITKWFFDVELLFRYKNLLKSRKNSTDFGNTVLELPLNRWEDIVGSKLKLSDFIMTPIELFRIHLKYNRR